MFLLAGLLVLALAIRQIFE
ncbi:protein MgtR [Klebsiella aerogenes]|nr:protein MgtR [Klebsiella aerogenes]